MIIIPHDRKNYGEEKGGTEIGGVWGSTEVGCVIMQGIILDVRDLRKKGHS